ncbi:MAG: APC family permease [Nocardioidaceae bacterium]|nr:APC family permease [Nocardioidaceae bacterium]
MTTQSAEPVDVNGPTPDLKRVLGPKLLLLFIVGDILGAGIYAVTGEMALEVGGLVWLPFIVAFGVATLTAFSYLELVTKYPQAAGAALYTHKAFGIHFVTFLVAFVVMCSGITSASTASRFFADNFNIAFHLDWGKLAIAFVALLFMAAIASVNFRGVSESVKLNVVLTIVELTGLLIIIAIGAWAIMGGKGDTSRLTQINIPEGETAFAAVTAATALAFFAMVGFEDSVNMVEETQDPVRIFPRVMFTGLGIAVVFYVLVALSVIAVIPEGQIEAVVADEGKVLLAVVEKGAPGLPIDKVFPFLTVVAVANTALLNMLMASRLLYGLAHQDVLPRTLGKVLPGRRTPYAGIVFSTLLALGLIVVVTFYADTSLIVALSGTTALLLLCVFAVVNVACIVLRRDPRATGGFQAPRWVPLAGAVACLFLAGPWARDREDWIQYQVAGGLLLLGIVLWACTWFTNRAVRAQKTGFRDIEHMED